jgi:cell division protein FtsB
LLSKTKQKKKHRKQWLIHFLVLRAFMLVFAVHAKSGKCIAQCATIIGAAVVAVVATMEYCNEDKTSLMSYC